MRTVSILIAILLLRILSINAQSAWPSESWTAAQNLTSVMDPAGLTELSGLFWNDNTNRLYVSHGDGRLRVLQYNSTSHAFTQLANQAYSGGPEGITQVNLAANEFYTIDENNYQIRKYTHSSSFGSLTLSKSWNIVAAPSTMTNTGNTGPEGITFIPDSFLAAAGFISSQTGQAYISAKGMGGLIFVAHQNGGYVWVFDINPNVSNDFLFVGRYKTNRTESCELAFDRTTGLLYILHNISGNTLEVTDLKSSVVSGERKFNTFKEYAVGNPTGNLNVEGFAISSKCNDSTNVKVWLCRDVESTESSTYKVDCLRMFNPFSAPGSCNQPVQYAFHVKAFIQGYYIGNGKMKPVINPANNPSACDSVTLELRQSTGNHSIQHISNALFDVDGNATFTFAGVMTGSTYYLVLKHRSALETWSALPVTLTGTSLNYSFSDLPGKAFGNREVAVDASNYALYNGDINQDGSINSSDISEVRTKAQVFSIGYLKQDINGDWLTESTDLSLVENNSNLLITVAHP